MSHFIGLVFLRDDDDLETILEPFNEQSDEYAEFNDKTQEVKELFAKLPQSVPSEGKHKEIVDKTDLVINIWKEAPQTLSEEQKESIWKPYTKDEFPTPRDIAKDKKFNIVPDESKEFGERYEVEVEHDWKYEPSLEKYPTINKLAKEYFGYRSVNGKFGYMANPNSKWDWYSEGGRWSGYIPKKDGKTADIVPFNEVDWDKAETPFCFVDDLGRWHEKGEMGFWAMVADEKPATDWGTEFKDYVKSISPEDAETIEVYAIDFHI